MDQNPLPRGSLQVRDRFGQKLRVVSEAVEAVPAVEAQYPAHPSGATIAIKESRSGRATDATAALLGRHHLVELDRTSSVRRVSLPFVVDEIAVVVQPP